jgi:hypothetical protein
MAFAVWLARMCSVYARPSRNHEFGFNITPAINDRIKKSDTSMCITHVPSRERLASLARWVQGLDTKKWLISRDYWTGYSPANICVESSVIIIPRKIKILIVSSQNLRGISYI